VPSPAAFLLCGFVRVCVCCLRLLLPAAPRLLCGLPVLLALLPLALLGCPFRGALASCFSAVRLCSRLCFSFLPPFAASCSAAFALRPSCLVGVSAPGAVWVPPLWCPRLPCFPWRGSVCFCSFSACCLLLRRVCFAVFLFVFASCRRFAALSRAGRAVPSLVVSGCETPYSLPSPLSRCVLFCLAAFVPRV
jgi:hypothetical protein